MDCKKPAGIDLHVHSTASDGTLTPAEILAMARDLNLGALAITDHDTISGVKEALQIDIPESLHFVTGVEISATPIPPFDIASSYHILGYFFDVDDPVLNQTLDQLQLIRRSRNNRIIRKLNRLGIDISLEETLRNADGSEMGRPHIARILVNKKIVTSIDDAFDAYLGKDKPAYVDKDRISCRRAMDIITNAGGIPVLAHPGHLAIDRFEEIESFVGMLKNFGLKGIEAYYPEHDPQQTDQYLKIAEKHDLLVTGGTDFHGEIKPEIAMGSGNGAFIVPFDLYEKLSAHAASYRNLDLLQTKLGYAFHNKEILEESIRHSSYVNEQVNVDIRDNERFEFLGDAVLNLVVGHLLMQRNPDLKEGDLTRIRANLVNEFQLATIARALKLGNHILLGKGEMQTGGHKKSSILADTLEAVIAAVYLDGGFQASFSVVEHLFKNDLTSLEEGRHTQDHKSQLQEYVQLHHEITPKYRVIHERGPDHQKTFHVQLDVCKRQTHGVGKTKKAAEQDAARNALKILASQDNTDACSD